MSQTDTPVWFITGCSTGFGRELARLVLDRGWRAVVTARNPSQVADLVQGHEDNALALQLDVTDAAQVAAAAKAAQDRFGKVDVLVNNAGYGYLAAIEEGEDAVEEGEKGPVLDAALIACGQAVEHYEIARYGTMVAWAKQMGNTQAQDLLQQILDEEKANDQLMTEIAERVLNPEAAGSGTDDDEGDEGEDESPEMDEEPAEDTKAKAKPKRAKK